MSLGHFEGLTYIGSKEDGSKFISNVISDVVNNAKVQKNASPRIHKECLARIGRENRAAGAAVFQSPKDMATNEPSARQQYVTTARRTMIRGIVP